MSDCSVLAGTDIPAGARYKHVRVRSVPAVRGRQRPHQGYPCQQALSTHPGFEGIVRLEVLRGRARLLRRLALTLAESLNPRLPSPNRRIPPKNPNHREPAAPPIRSRRMLPARDGRHQAHKDVLVACRSDLIGGAAGPMRPLWGATGRRCQDVKAGLRREKTRKHSAENWLHLRPQNEPRTRPEKARLPMNP